MLSRASSPPQRPPSQIVADRMSQAALVKERKKIRQHFSGDINFPRNVKPMVVGGLIRSSSQC